MPNLNQKLACRMTQQGDQRVSVTVGGCCDDACCELLVTADIEQMAAQLCTDGLTRVHFTGIKRLPCTSLGAAMSISKLKCASQGQHSHLPGCQGLLSL